MTGSTDHSKLGTFVGVYLPTVLTILGVIMFLRTGWLVGHLGLARAILVVVAANIITIITTLSFSSIATNITVGPGGAYYIVSRSLGPEIGGAIGVPLFFSQAFSVTLYAFGFAEALRLVWPEVPLQLAALVIVALVGGLAILGAGFALRTQIPILILVGCALFALTIGAMARSAEHQIAVTAGSGEIGFWAGFAVFFPAVTGVMAGLGLSGDLREPGRAIPLGSLLAVMTGFAVYLVDPGAAVAGRHPGAVPGRLADLDAGRAFRPMAGRAGPPAERSSRPPSVRCLVPRGRCRRWLWTGSHRVSSVALRGDGRALAPGFAAVAQSSPSALSAIGDLNRGRAVRHDVLPHRLCRHQPGRSPGDAQWRSLLAAEASDSLERQSPGWSRLRGCDGAGQPLGELTAAAVVTY